jgi:outer membrane protein
VGELVERANRVIRQIAEKENYDIIFQEAVYAHKRIDITDQVLSSLDNAK